jgi:hypothetical protein
MKSNSDHLNLSTVGIPESGAFFERFDCLHAGANYSKVNIRVQFFLDPRRSSVTIPDPVWRDVRDVRTPQTNVLQRRCQRSCVAQ